MDTKVLIKRIKEMEDDSPEASPITTGYNMALRHVLGVVDLLESQHTSR